MAMNYGDKVAKQVTQGAVQLSTGAWTALQVGSTPQANRFAVRLFSRGNIGKAAAIEYANIDGDGNFTTPTTSTSYTTLLPGGVTWIEPLSEKVTLYGRLVLKGGETDNTLRVIVTEFS